MVRRVPPARHAVQLADLVYRTRLHLLDVFPSSSLDSISSAHFLPRPLPPCRLLSPCGSSHHNSCPPLPQADAADASAPKAEGDDSKPDNTITIRVKDQVRVC